MYMCTHINAGTRMCKHINLSVTHICSSTRGSERVSFVLQKDLPHFWFNVEHGEDEMGGREARKRLGVIRQQWWCGLDLVQGELHMSTANYPWAPHVYTGPGIYICGYMVHVFRHTCILEHAAEVKEELEDWTVSHKGTWWKKSVLEGRVWGRYGIPGLIPRAHQPPLCQAGPVHHILPWNSPFQLCRPQPGFPSSPSLGHSFNSRWGPLLGPPDVLSTPPVSP